MSLPLYMKDAFGYPTGLVAAVLLGILFGFVLERAGFGRASVLAAQFYFRDMRVLKVMFSAIVIALLGMTILGGTGILDMGALQIPPTFLWPQLAGGLLLGAGFIISGYCPGTGVVAMASGKWDGLAAIAGVMAGSVLFGFFYPLYAGFYVSGSMGAVTFPSLLGLPQAFLAAGVALMAVGAFLGAEKAERAFAAKDRGEPPAGLPGTRRRVFALFGAAAAIGVLTLLVPRTPPVHAGKTIEEVSAIELARLVVDDPTSYWLVDLRQGAEPERRIPGSLTVPEDDPDAAYLADLPGTRRLILYGDRTLDVLPASASRFTGDVFVLEGGYRAFAERILEAPFPPESPTAAAIDEYKLLFALHTHFTGSEAKTEAPAVMPRKIERAGEKKAGGC
ncbi:MAG: YeeE/YedE thiosulfate transporter family protein [Candidatus Eisenbacteria bacterium]